ncbi:hypothetical protein GCM10010862_22250 [Devosia nitrariae]|uniref:Uncharacterized protein n=1 Tax=Devosia nitrariae TaxID=2071872 RepID=A0ABQ5W4W0_9HYPH|nr:hypothetical protein GCM10010862_22250 [Devosia nitrariae]
MSMIAYDQGIAALAGDFVDEPDTVGQDPSREKPPVHAGQKLLVYCQVPTDELLYGVERIETDLPYEWTDLAE